MVTGMGRPLVHAAAWFLATSAAVTLSWFGVHTVLAGTEYDPPRTLPLSDEASTARPGAPGTQEPEPPPSRSSPPPSGSQSPKPPEKPSPSATGGTGKPQPQPPETEQPAPEGDVRGTDVPGGRAVFDMKDDYATLVSATPDDGWDTQVFKDTTWIRVTFSKHGSPSHSVFCRWDDGPPRIETFQG